MPMHEGFEDWRLKCLVLVRTWYRLEPRAVSEALLIRRVIGLGRLQNMRPSAWRLHKRFGPRLVGVPTVDGLRQQPSPRCSDFDLIVTAVTAFFLSPLYKPRSNDIDLAPRGWRHVRNSFCDSGVPSGHERFGCASPSERDLPACP